MTRSFPLQPLLDLSQWRLDEAARDLGKMIASESEASARLAALEHYRSEYRQRFLESAHQGIGREAWGNYQAFLARLDEAIEQARALLQASSQRTAQGQREWLSRRGNVQAYHTLSERHRARALHMQTRSEQKNSDEHAAQRFHARRSEEEPGG